MSKPKLVFSESDASPALGTRLALRFPAGQSGEASALEPLGFSGSCENTSLTDWIQLVQMGRRDAVVTVRAHDGKMGRLWCRDGDIIDASCDGVAGVDAVYRALSWEGGRVVVDFRTFERARQIPIATSALLLEAAYRSDSHIRVLGSDPSAPPPQELASVSARPSWIPSPGLAQEKKRRRPPGMDLALAGGLSAFVLLAVLLSTRGSHWSRPQPAERTAPRSAGVDMPPRPRVILTQSDAAPLGVGTGRVPTVARDRPSRSPGSTRVDPVSAAARPAFVQLKRPHPVASEKPQELALAKLDIPITEERSPRIQVIEERTPRIEEIQ